MSNPVRLTVGKSDNKVIQQSPAPNFVGKYSKVDFDLKYLRDVKKHYKVGYLLTGGYYGAGASNLKIEKSQGTGKYKAAIMHLLPSDLSGLINTCPMASEGCKATCLNKAGHGERPAVQEGRYRRTRWLQEYPQAFLAWLSHEITKFKEVCLKEGMKPAIRLNGTSDMAWERISPWLFTDHPEVQFYDYTKIHTRFKDDVDTNFGLPANYKLTLSRSEDNETQALDHLWRGGTVAVVYKVDKKHYIPNKWHDFNVIDGDKHDFRFMDPAYSVVGLKAKGRAQKDTTGFVLRVPIPGESLAVAA